MQMAFAFMLAYPYGYPRLMPSFFLDDQDQGPAHDDSGNIVPQTVNPSGAYGNGCVCEHRWKQIFNVVDFRNVVAGTEYSINPVTFHQYRYLMETLVCVNIAKGRYY